MECLHPFCPMKRGAKSWDDVVASPLLSAKKPAERAALLSALKSGFKAPGPAPANLPSPVSNAALVKRLLNLCPCLFNQINVEATAEAVVHFCEISLGQPLTSANVYEAFLVQHPSAPKFKVPPAKPCRNGGDVMEMLCSEVLENEQIPRMSLQKDKWPEWRVPGHMLLNKGSMRELRALGDILIPCAPTNLLISVKSEVARERLLYSANSIEGIGFGFFKEPEEFWTSSRMRLFKRMGFTAIYLPDHTHGAIVTELASRKTKLLAVNLNGTQLYRPMTQFGADMRRVVGRSSFDL
jgi:hypothetical protein